MGCFPCWQPKTVSISTARTWSVQKSEFTRGILWWRLNAQNWYHHLFEDYQAILRVRMLTFGDPFDAKTDYQVVFLDKESLQQMFIDTYSWMFSRRPVALSALHTLQVPELAVGSQTTCGHRYHCKYPFEEGSLLRFREAVLNKLLDKPLAPVNPSPKVGFIQRAGFRKFEHLKDLLKTVESITRKLQVTK